MELDHSGGVSWQEEICMRANGAWDCLIVVVVVWGERGEMSDHQFLPRAEQSPASYRWQIMQLSFNA